MKKPDCITAALCAAAVLAGCYAEIEPEPPSARGGLLPIAGAYNVRDIGGYTSADGKTIKSGKLIRSGDLNLLTERDKDYLFGTLGVKTVVDFRSKKLTVDDSLTVTSEAESAPDRLPEGIKRVWEETAINESVIVPDYEAVIGDTYANPNAVIEAVKTGYKRIVGGIPGEENAKAQYKKFFETLLASNGDPVLFHCSAGKDRTGIATALLLSALGVDRETIIKDYLASAENVAEKYYPVGPFIEQTVKDMRDAAILLTQPSAVGFVEQKLAETVKPKVAESIIASQSATIPNWEGMPYQQKRAAAQQIVDGFFASPNAAYAITSAVEQYKTRIAPMAQIPDIDGYAAGARAKVQPLLTVKREYIEAAFQVIGNDVSAYLTNELGLSLDQIQALKTLYLE